MHMQVHYIRCVKPNHMKKARKFEVRLAVEQLPYAGVFEAVTLSKRGDPFRCIRCAAVATEKRRELSGLSSRPLPLLLLLPATSRAETRFHSDRRSTPPASKYARTRASLHRAIRAGQRAG